MSQELPASGAAAGPAQKTRGLLFLAVGLVILVVFFYVLMRGLQLRSAPPLAAGTAPDFTLTTFDGQKYALQDLRGKVIVLNFWASWCVPCRDEAPLLQKAWEKYKDKNVLILGVDYIDTDPEAKKFMAEFNQTYPNGPDVGTRISQAYRITGVPETYFIGKDGRIFQGTDSLGRANGNFIGPLPEGLLNDRIEAMLKE